VKEYANRSIFSEDMDKSIVSPFFDSQCIYIYTHTQPFYGSLDFAQDNPGEPVPEETFTHSHLS